MPTLLNGLRQTPCSFAHLQISGRLAELLPSAQPCRVLRPPWVWNYCGILIEIYDYLGKTIPSDGAIVACITIIVIASCPPHPAISRYHAQGLIIPRSLVQIQSPLPNPRFVLFRLSGECAVRIPHSYRTESPPSKLHTRVASSMISMSSR